MGEGDRVVVEGALSRTGGSATDLLMSEFVGLLLPLIPANAGIQII